MLSKLDENPPDTSLVIDKPPNPLPPPQHPRAWFFLYLLIGFVVFAVICALGVWGILYFFKTDIKSFMENTKSDAYALMKIKQPQLSATPSPKPTWILYTNTLQQYNFLYPSDWLIKEDTDESIILYPPGSSAYAELTQGDFGAGIGPKMTITIVTRPYIVPNAVHTTIKTTSGITGYSYTDDSISSLPLVDFPFHNKSNILEFKVQNIGQENINEHLKAHKSTRVVQDIPSETFNKIVNSLQFSDNN